MKKLKRPIKLAVGWLLVLIGLITAPLPLPLGQLVTLVGLSLLISESYAVRMFTRKLRRNYPMLNGMMDRVRPYMPAFLKSTIDETDPRHLNCGMVIPNQI
ncbi:MAG: hypothetical protein COB54_05815 [Alphaproteobacteria bacterium]|nr:MAG: hypothetical protein COB54_05815 [Alphaproteobacteria bacterium]